MSGLILRDVLLLLVAAAVAALAFVDLRLRWASGILIALAVLGTVALIIIAWGRWSISGIWVGITIVTGTLCLPLLLVDDYRRNRKEASYPSNPRLLTTTRIDLLGISLASLMLLLIIAAAAMETLSSHMGVAIVWDLMLGIVGITFFVAIARLPTRGRKHDR
jgi:threonine/homoserine efflux transporter RhtA